MTAEQQRQLRITEILITCTTLVLLLLFATVIYNSATMGNSYHGIPPLYFGVICIYALTTYLFNIKKFLKISSYGLIAIYYFGATFGALTWGPDLPMVSLAYVLVILIAFIVLPPKKALIASVVVAVTFSIVWHDEAVLQFVKVDRTWKNSLFDGDIFEFTVMYVIIAVICWIGSTQIYKSLYRAETSEALLKEERDSLDIKVKEKTLEINRMHAERMETQYRFIEIGRLSAGIFHDLSTPLTALSLVIDRMKNINETNRNSAKEELQRLQKTSAHLTELVQLARSNFSPLKECTAFSVVEVIESVLKMLSHKIIDLGTLCNVKIPSQIIIQGNPLRFQQVVLNIVNNALDSLESNPQTKSRTLTIYGHKNKNAQTITFVDTGSGMDEQTQSKIFEPFFTTKPSNKGVGIGLSQTKQIIEKEFSGNIVIKSELGKGTSFKLIINR